TKARQSKTRKKTGGELVHLPIRVQLFLVLWPFVLSGFSLLFALTIRRHFKKKGRGTSRCRIANSANKGCHENPATAQPSRPVGQPVQPGRRQRRPSLQDRLRRPHIPSLLGQDHWRSGSAVIGRRFRREGERQNRPAHPDGRVP